MCFFYQTHGNKISVFLLKFSELFIYKIEFYLSLQNLYLYSNIVTGLNCVNRTKLISHILKAYLEYNVFEI